MLEFLFGTLGVCLLVAIAVFLDQIRDELQDIAWLLEQKGRHRER